MARASRRHRDVMTPAGTQTWAIANANPLVTVQSRMMVRIVLRKMGDTARFKYRRVLTLQPLQKLRHVV